MVLDYYNLREQPFGVTPDPRCLYMSPTHREALASLSYGIQSGRGFMSVIAKPGMGKTTILFRLLSQLQGTARTVFLFQTLGSPEDLFRALLHDLGVVRIGKSVARMQEQLNKILLGEAREKRKVVVVIDEAQNLDDSALELLRMLSNFETTEAKLMQIILAGQPQLRERLASPQLLQLRQRISISARLLPFNIEETRLYVGHRLRSAGYDSHAPLFTPQAEALISEYSEGIPRNINNICFNALSLGCVLKQRTIREEVVREVLRDMDLVTETAQARDDKFAGRRLVAFGARKIRIASQQAFAWRKRLAFSALLILPLVWFSGQRHFPALPGFDPLHAVSRSSQILPKPLVASATQAAASGAGLRDAGTSTPARNSRRRGQPGVTSTSDPAKLWARVKRGSSDAEVRLALLYLEGTDVPQNCAQAQALLLAASQKGNARAADALSNYRSQCP
jgi:type II secretory pathway predicted ATPase ExeA